jgi:hypothetical protein
MAERVKAKPELLRQRKALIEHVFGTLKRSMDQGYFLMRTHEKVFAELCLSVVAYNFKRVLSILGPEGLRAAILAQISGSWRQGWWLVRVSLPRNGLLCWHGRSAGRLFR